MRCSRTPSALNITNQTPSKKNQTPKPKVDLHSLGSLHNFIQCNFLIFAPEVIVLCQEKHAMALLQIDRWIKG